MLLNYSDTINDAFTVAHEMGHTMHTVLSHSHQPFATSSSPYNNNPIVGTPVQVAEQLQAFVDLGRGRQIPASGSEESSSPAVPPQ